MRFGKYSRFFTVGLAAAAAVFMLTACHWGTPGYPETFPQEWKNAEFLEKESRRLAPGIVYFHYRFVNAANGEALSLYLVEVKWDETDGKVKFVAGGETGKRLPVTEIFAGRKVFAAINGAYFDWKTATPTFMLKTEGKVQLPAAGKQVFSDGALVSQGNHFPRIVKLTEKNIGEYDNVLQGYWIGKNGKNVFTKPGMDRTPYTVVGLDPEKRILLLWVNDGRHAKDAPGIAFTEIPDYLFKLGATEVLSIDGGGSSTMALPDETGELQVVNRPSDNRAFDHGGARAVQSAAALVPAE